MSIDKAIVAAALGLLAAGSTPAGAEVPGLIAPESATPAVTDWSGSPRATTEASAPPAPAPPAEEGGEQESVSSEAGETGAAPMPERSESPGVAEIPPTPAATGVSPVPGTATTARVPTTSACPYCGDPDCRRGRRSPTCCERVKAALYMHFGRGAPGYVHTPVPPPGGRLHAIMGWQITGGQAALQVLYDYDFVQDEAELNVRGRRQLWKVAHRAMRGGHPIIIEATPYRPELGDKRLEAVVRELARLDVPVAPERVIVARPPGRPTEGEELPLLYTGFLGLGNAAGPLAPGGAPAGPATGAGVGGSPSLP